MEICGKPVRKNFGNPYKNSKEGDWLVSVRIDNKKSKLLKAFKTKPEADEYVQNNDNKWFVSVTDGGHNIIREEIFGDIKSAQAYVRENKDKQKQILKDKQANGIDNETTFLEERIGIGTETPMLRDDSSVDPEVNEQLEKSIEDHRDEFDLTLATAEDDAKSLLLSVAQLYLDENIIDDNNYIKFKMVIEQKGLSSLIFQLDIARKALFKLSEQIHSGSHSPRNYEVLTQLQRIVLDVTKYQHEYLDDIEESMKKLSEDYTSGKTSGGGVTTIVESEDGEVSIIGTNNRVKLLEQINGLISESKENKTPQSVNTNLYVDSDDMTDAVEIKTGDEDDGSDDDEDISQLGLESM